MLGETTGPHLGFLALWLLWAGLWYWVGRHHRARHEARRKAAWHRYAEDEV